MNLQNYYETVMQLSHGIVVTLDLDGGIIHGNYELEALCGLSLRELAGKDWFATFVPESSREEARNILHETMSNGGISTASGAITTRDGDTVYIDWNLKPLTDSTGDPVSILCVGQDVTDHMLRQKGLLHEKFTLIERNKGLNCLYEISQLMGDTDREAGLILDKVVQLLPSAFQRPNRTHIFLSVDEKKWGIELPPDAEHTLSENIVVNKEKRGVLAVYVEARNNGRRNHRVFIEDEKDLLATAAQQVATLVGKKETKRAKQVLEQQLRRADRLAKIGQFSAGVAHEINEPLANILGFAQLALQDKGLPEQVAADLNNIVDSSLHAREIIRKLMFFSRQMPPQFVPTDLNDAIHQALRITENAARKSNIKVHCEYAADLPDVMADPQHIKQVIVNLAANAIQAMEDGGELRVETINHENDAYIIVEDTGPGMDREQLKQIFNPFYTTKDVDKGTGLGLSVVHGIIKAHEGFIQVDSTPGKGTRVEVAFPFRPNSCMVD